MSFIDDLRNARSATKTVLFHLLFTYRANGGTLHAFFEGQDEESYFTSFLRFYVPGDYALFAHRCRGKSGVITAFGAIDRAKYDIRRLLFFVDRDYSDLLGEVWPADSNIYTTDYYAIENHVAESEVLRRYIRDILHVDDPVSEALLVAKYETQRERFYAYLLPVCAWIIYIMRQPQPLGPNLSNIKLGELFQVSDELEVLRVQRSPKGVLAYLDESTGVQTPSGAWRHIRLVVEELATRWPPKSWLRGKFELWFFVEFATRIPNLLNRQDLRGDKRVIVRTNMNHSNAMEILAPRAVLPASLKTFLDHHIARLPH